jgi:hypothetical protein
MNIGNFIDQTFCCDCLDLLPLLPDGSADMVPCDLPYGTTQNKWDVIVPFELCAIAERRLRE